MTREIATENLLATSQRVREELAGAISELDSYIAQLRRDIDQRNAKEVDGGVAAE